jgi:CRISPR-associated endonuclease/helicase Cas3
VLETARLGASVSVVWGKSGDQDKRWLPLSRHLADSAAVAGQLWTSWVSRAVRQRISGEIPGGDEAACVLVQWLAGIHDIGKATPAFAWQASILSANMQDHGFNFPRGLDRKRPLVPHATAGQIVLADWLVREHGWPRHATGCLAVVVGGHHGVPPTDNDLRAATDVPHALGMDGLWPQVRHELLTWMTDRLAAADVLDRLREVATTRPDREVLSQPTQALLTALVIMADWIASNERYFPLDVGALADPARVDDALAELDLPAPWQAGPKTSDAAVLLRERFGLAPDVTPFPVQSAAVAAAAAMAVPGLLIIEAPMGDGKTEAALLAVELLAARSGAGGCYFALPTRATSNAIFKRALAWLRRVPDEDIRRGARDVALVHGKAMLNTDYSALFTAPLPDSIGVDAGGAETAVHPWFAGRKRKLLTSFAIGTVDQLLFMALQSKHLALRHLGLAGKVVVIDEAHAYDEYMSQYLDRALHWLGAHGAPVVVLSATLPGHRRAQMMQAYDSGRLGADPGAGAYEDVRSDRRYPLLTYSGPDGAPVSVSCSGSSRRTSVSLGRHADDPEELAATLKESLVDGGCALVVCNTVRRVQDVAGVLRDRLGPETPVTVAHSRFLGPDREAKDAWLVDVFGPPDRLAATGHARPDRHVVVASQVVEQSLDIDFDLLITDLAPVDLMLQRIGRLHRHTRRDRPAALRQARCLVIGADWQNQPPKPDAGSVAVYGRSGLLRSAGVLWGRLEQGQPLVLPDDIPALVQTAYGDDPVGPADWQPVMRDAAVEAGRQAAKRIERAKAFLLKPVRNASLVGWLAAQVGDTESPGGDEARGRAHVRDGGGETVEVIVLIRRDGELVIPPWLPDGGGEVVPTHTTPPTRVSRRAAMCSLALPRVMTDGSRLDDVIGELEERHTYPAWEKDPWLGGELILDLDEHGHGELAGFTLHYDRHDGLRVERHAAA